MPRGLVSSLTCPLQVAMASIDAAIQAFSEASAKVKNRGGYTEVNRRSQT